MTATRRAPGDRRVPDGRRIAAGLAALFTALTAVVVAAPRWLTVDLDGRVSTAVRGGLAGRTTLLATLRVLTWLGHPLVVDAVVLAAVGALWWRRRPGDAVALLGLGLASLALRGLVKTLVARPRPQAGFSTATGGSFPSGHTAGAAFVAVAAVLLVRRAWVVVTATAYAVVIGASRVLLNVHWLSDVAGGLVLGAAFAALLPWAGTTIGERPARGDGSALPDR